MHGAAQMATLIAWFMGATLVYVRRFDAAEVWRTIEREKVNSLTITGDAMAIPMAEELARGDYVRPRRSLVGSARPARSSPARSATGSGAAAEHDDHGPLRVDRVGLHGRGVAGSTPEKGLRFAPDVGGRAPCWTTRSSRSSPGSGVIGQVARTGHIAHRLLQRPGEDGRDVPRWCDGGAGCSPATSPPSRRTGRSPCSAAARSAINTGGEKVFPEEVEAVLKGHPAVYDAVVIGIPDERWGNRVAAVVQPRRARARPPRTWTRTAASTLSGYKVPRGYAFVDGDEALPRRQGRLPLGQAGRPRGGGVRAGAG